MTERVRAVSLHVTGIVQGVGFRPFVYNLAYRLGVTGWVKNTSDGVYAVAEGDPATVAAFVAGIRDGAPPMAVVESVVAEDVDAEVAAEQLATARTRRATTPDQFAHRDRVTALCRAQLRVARRARSTT
jgi:hydrogenase maturation protein HypF